MTKGFVFIILLGIVPLHHTCAQYKFQINAFFEKEFGKKVDFEIDLPYKVKVKSEIIKRSDGPGVLVYNFKPVGRKNKITCSISQSPDSAGYFLYLLKEEGTVEKKLGNTTFLLKFRYTADDRDLYYAMILKQINIGSEIHSLICSVRGDPAVLDKELPQLLNSFHASTISY